MPWRRPALHIFAVSRAANLRRVPSTRWPGHSYQPRRSCIVRRNLNLSRKGLVQNGLRKSWQKSASGRSVSEGPMKNDFQPKSGDRSQLPAFEREVLEMKVLPKARQWMLDYPEGSPMHGHARQTLAYWGEV